MKKALLIAFAILFVAGFAHGTDWIGLYTDAGHTVYTMGPSFTLYVFVNNLDHYMWAVGFKLVFPSCATPGPVELGPHLTFSDGDITINWGGYFDGCCTSGWWEVCHMPVTMVGSCPGQTIDIQPGDEWEPHMIQFVDCFYELWELAVLHGVVGTKETSWGAIKSLF